MIPIAAVLLLIVLVFSIAVVVSNPGAQDFLVFNARIPANDAGIYFTGAGAMLVLILALGLLRTGLKREAQRRKQIKTLKAAADGRSVASAAPASKQPTTTSTHKTAEPAKAPAQTQAASDAAKTLASSKPASGEPEPKTTAAERQALADEGEGLTGDTSER